MGNSLCKEPNANRSLRPGRMFNNFGNVMCPNGLGKNKTGFNKTYLGRHVLETTPKPSTADSWRSATLSVPDGGGNVIDRPPVAPPRKKRSTLERGTSPQTLKVKNGFKDVFGADSRRASHDVQTTTLQDKKSRDTVDGGLSEKTQSSYEIGAKVDAFSDFSIIPTKTELEKPKVEVPMRNHVPPKTVTVGNRKSDKFFGENLSDSLSIIPVVTERRRSSKKGMEDLDKIDQFIEKNVLKSTFREPSRNDGSVVESQLQNNIVESKVPTEVKSNIDDNRNDLNEKMEKQINKPIDETVAKETHLGKKAEFLMAMLEDYQEDRYLGMVPVEEPVIVPRKRKTRHICDDTDHMHNLLHNHENKQSSKNLITTEASIETPPRKPNRDFGKYLASLNSYSDSDESSSTKPVRKQRPVSRRSLSTPPLPPKLPKSMSETQLRINSAAARIDASQKTENSDDAKAHSPRTLKRIISMPSTTNLMKAESRSSTPQPPLLKSSSSSSFLMKDLQKAQMSMGKFIPEDHHYNAADELVKPKSRLTHRKISVRSVDSNPGSTTPTQEVNPPKFTIGSREVVRSPPILDNMSPPKVPKRRKSSASESKNSSMLEPITRKRPLPKEILGFDLGTFMVSSQVLHHHDITNVMEMVFNGSASDENIIEEFQAYLEDQINSEINDPNSKNPNSVKLLKLLNENSYEEDEDILDDVKLDLVDSDDSNKLSDIDDCFDQEFERIEKNEIYAKLSPKLEIKTPVQKGRAGSTDEVSAWFETESELGSVVERSDKLGNMVNVKSCTPRLGRRESIEDVDDWFKFHTELFPAKETFVGVRKQRRGSDGFVTYDTTRQYPFGEARHRRDSLSAELFEDITKLHDLGVDKEKLKSPVALLKNQRLQERRGSDGLVVYDTSCKFPFGEPNTDLPRALEKQSKDIHTNNETKKSTANDNDEVPKEHKTSAEKSNETEHSTLLKFFSKENLIE
ncbi:uncharacterized protein LOC131435617 [Malaya genurostris]|uniref:uncharacterized protein LOC131435617 n=1 Tax=Malaya genurostris TaxID=325434 RepID=UPI0026F4096B|nr:uncharacterized protein LOC131435617 [Malaya genurostris]XP_058459670.1 uncharacterized protein LOC131435617 [Malaya genurostris]XP_058459671.1 uncharacterized protein LOC131435617 [Malaya genurostris]XP_058459672.1 uncharacterized protein LOC131435617 [Malaya genurostris]